MKNLRSKLTYANVVATLALFIAIGGASAFAASQLGKNSVGTKQLKKDSVTTAKIKKDAVTGAKVKKQTLTGSDINLNKLGTVPNATHANSADSIPPAEPIHLIGAPGEPGFEMAPPIPRSHLVPIAFRRLAFTRTRSGSSTSKEQ